MNITKNAVWWATAVTKSSLTQYFMERVVPSTDFSYDPINEKKTGFFSYHLRFFYFIIFVIHHILTYFAGTYNFLIRFVIVFIQLLGINHFSSKGAIWYEITENVPYKNTKIQDIYSLKI